MVEDLRCRRRSLKEFPRRRHAGSARFQPIVKPVDAPRAALVAVDEARREVEKERLVCVTRADLVMVEVHRVMS